MRDAHADPLHVATFTHCEAFLAPTQGAPGWCTLVLRDHAEHLAMLDESVQREVFAEVARVASAIRAVFPTSGVGGGPPRINYECLGNVEPHVHWHVIPRHASDLTPGATVWGWTPEQQRGRLNDAARLALAAQVREALRQRHP